MTLSKLKFNPGVNRDMTDYTNTGGWFDCDKVRFRNGLPEKIGGWQQFIPEQFAGTARDLLRWASLNGTIYTSVATNLKVYINGGSLGELQDVTPLRATALNLNNPFACTSDSNIITVTDAAHGCIEGDYVTFEQSADFGGIDAALYINKEHVVSNVIDSSRYQIVIGINAGSTVTAGGGTGVDAYYQINVGLDTLVFGTGWGAGPFGGANSPESVATLANNPITTTSGSTTVTIARVGAAAAGYAAGDSVVISGVTGNVGGIANKFFNKPVSAVTSTGASVTLVGGSFRIESVATDSYTIIVGKAASSSATGGGSAVVESYFKKNTSTGWGEAADESTLALQLRLWSLDNFGEDLLMNPRDGGIYVWVEDTPTQRAKNITEIPGADNCPTIATKVLVSEIGQHVMAFGADPFGGGPQDKMLVRWSTDQSYLNWDEADTAENAGSIRLSNGSFIVNAEQTRQEILVWTDSALYSIQYQGATYLFTATLISSGTDIIGPNATVTAVNTTFWMGSDNFYYYDGALNRMPCTVREKVFLDLNFEQRYKVYAGINSENNEVTWYYPSANSTENNRYVTYNYAEKAWYYGTMARTAWVDRGFGDSPIAASTDYYLYYHEVGADDGSTNPPSPILAYIESSPVEIEEGDKFSFISRIIPDISFRNTPNQFPEGEVTFSIRPQNYPGALKGTPDVNPVFYNYSVNTFTDQLFTRIRGRSVILRVSSDGLGVAWRLGTPRLDIRLDGRR